MKSVFVLLYLFPILVVGQTEGRKLLAHYPLTEHFGDITGQEDTLETAHIIIDEEGMYIDGADIRSDTANQAQVTIEALDLDDFYISLEVNIDSIPEDGILPISSRDIITCGLSWRWMRAITNQQFNYIALWRSGGAANSTTLLIRNEWIEIGLSYQAESDIARLFINGGIVIRDSFELIGGNDKTIGLPGISVNSWPMKGHWRNLKVYGPDNRKIPLSLSCMENQLPTDESSLDGSIEIEIQGGVAPYELKWNGGDTILQESGSHIIDGLGLGTFSFELRDSLNVLQNCQTVLQIEGLLPLIAYYPMNGNLEDALMMNPAIQIEHVDVLDSAIYIDGADSFSDTANVVWINSIQSLNHDEFEFKLDFKLDSIHDPAASQNRTIFIAGSSYRWVSLLYDNRSKVLNLGYNGFQTSSVSIPFEFDQWYEMSITYSYSTRLLSLWIDGEKVDEIKVVLNTLLGRDIIVDCRCGRLPMKGYWRNLRVYSQGQSQIHPLKMKAQVSQWNSSPNSEDGSVQIDIEGGFPVYTVQLFKQDSLFLEKVSTSLNVEVEDLPIGLYDIVVQDQFDSIRSTTLELLPPQTELPILSYYPMQFDLNDTADIHNPLSLAQTEFIFNQGIAIPGNENDTSGIDQVATYLTELNTDDFYISMHVIIDSIDGLDGGDKRSIFIGGQLFRWMYPHYFQSTKMIGLTYNNNNISVGKYSFEYGREYEIAMAYSREEQVGTWFVNRQEVGRDTFDMMAGDDLSFGLNCYCGPEPMKGFWRDLRIYSAPVDTVSTSIDDLRSLVQLEVFPNPASQYINIELKETLNRDLEIKVFDILGRLVDVIDVVKGTQSIRKDIGLWREGHYILLLDEESIKFFKN